MMCNFARYVVFILTISVVGESYAQSPPTQLYIPENVTFYVAENSVVHIENGYAQIGDVVYFTDDLAAKSPEVRKKKITSTKSNLATANTEKVIKKETTKVAEKAEDKCSITFPFQNIPNGAFILFNSKQIVPPPTLTFKFKKESKIIVKNNFVPHNFLKPLLEFSLQECGYATTHNAVLQECEAVVFHLSRPPPHVLV